MTTAVMSPPMSPYGQRLRRPDPYRVKVYDEALAFQLRQPVPAAQTAPHSPISSHPLNSSRSTNGPGGGTGTYMGTFMQTSRTLGSGQAPPSSPRSQERLRQKIEEAKRMRLAEKYALEQARLQAETERLVQERKAAQAAAKEARYAHLFGQVMEGHALVDELDRAMDIVDSAEHNKRLKQHAEWMQNVYGAIQDNIRNQIDGMDPKALSRQKQADYQSFLDESNRKPCIFLDVVSAAEYDPFVVNRRAIRAHVPKLVDPTSRPTDRYAEENAMLSSSGGQRVPSRDGRLTLETELWASGKIKDTPHGFMAKMLARRHTETGTRPSSASAATVSTSKASRVPMDHYNILRGKDAIESEFPRGKRTFPDGLPQSKDKPRGRRAVAGPKSLIKL